jgi:two-component system sensor histidine kinase KdpD
VAATACATPVPSRAALRRENQTTALYEFSRALSAAVTVEQIAQTVTEHIERTLGGRTTLWTAGNGALLAQTGLTGDAGEQALADEQAIAQWVFNHGQPAGCGTDTLPAAARLHLPLLQGPHTSGVLSVGLDGAAPDREQQRLLASFANQTALAVDRVQLAEKARQAQVLREMERLQSALLNSISHDLRTPLASITGALSSLKDDAAFLDAAAQADLVETALGESERLNRLVGNLLDMSRLESGAVRLKLEPCDVEDLVGVVLEQMSNRLRDHPVQIELLPDLPLVPLDFVLVVQVLVNLLDNAAKYAPKGSPIEISTHVDNAAVEIDVADHGPGIPPSLLSKVFDKFYRVEEGDKSVGSGLGLTIAKAIVEAHRGSIVLANRPEGGTLARMRFPLSAQPEGTVADDE